MPDQFEHGRKTCTLEYLGVGNLGDVEGVGHTAFILDRCLHVVVKGSKEAVEFWRATDLWKNVKQPFPADQVRNLSQVYEGYICRGACVVLCISPEVGGGRISCPPRSVLLGSHTETRGRRAQQVSGDALAQPEHRVSQQYSKMRDASVVVTVTPFPLTLVEGDNPGIPHVLRCGCQYVMGSWWMPSLPGTLPLAKLSKLVLCFCCGC